LTQRDSIKTFVWSFLPHVLSGNDATFSLSFSEVDSSSMEGAVRYAVKDEKQAQNGTEDSKIIRRAGRLPMTGMLDGQDCTSEANEAQELR
jgi:hypothetical protein